MTGDSGKASEVTWIYDSDADPLDGIVEEFVCLVRQGQKPEVSEFCRRYPEWAGKLRDLLPTVAAMEERKPEPPPTTVLKVPRQLGDFRIVREIGRGGMGVVFEAEQVSLGRKVALKLLAQQGPVDARGLERFHREALAASRLNHANIVPVYGAGEQDGFHFYVMQFIPGEGLDSLIDRRRRELRETAVLPRDSDGPRQENSFRLFTPAYWKWVASVTADVAGAIHYAHVQGILHRDIKPANLLLDPQGVIRVADFGLAKLASESTLTGTHEFVGTLRYMAPESLAGNSDVRSDIYSLGITLYELATLTPAFDAPTTAQLMHQLAQHAPAPPSLHVPSIPRDLETIILKSIAREPKRRYRSAADLADDLHAFLEDRPVLARRAPAWELAWHWCRRNRIVAALLATTVLALFTTAIAGWVGYVRTTAALTEAHAATQRANDNVQLSLEAFDSIFHALDVADSGPEAVGSGEPQPPDTARQTASDAELLETIVTFYEKFASRNETNPRLQLEAIRAHRRIADLRHRLGDDKAETAARRRAKDLLDRLAAEMPNDPEVQFEQARLVADQLRSNAGSVWNSSDASQLEQVLNLARELNRKTPADARYAELLASILRTRAEQASRLTDDPRTVESFREASAVLDRVDPANRPPHFSLLSAEIRLSLVDFLARNDRNREGLGVLRDVIASVPSRGPDENLPESLRRRRDEILWRAFNRVAELSHRENEPLAAETARRRAEEFRNDRRGPQPRFREPPRFR